MRYTARVARYTSATADRHEDMLARIKRQLIGAGVTNHTLLSIVVEDGYEGEPSPRRQPDGWRVTVAVDGHPPRRVYTCSNTPHASVLDEHGAPIDDQLH